MTQDEIFISGEGDAYFRRNKDHINHTFETDMILKLIKRNNLKPDRVFEAGCSSASRLEALRKEYGCECYGIDPSYEAIEKGMRDYPRLSLSRSTISESRFADQFFDMVIVNFVFHWIDRSLLLESCAKLDHCLKWGGYLIIGDFYKPGFVKRAYHHVDTEEMFTYKQCYPDIFLATGNYSIVASEIYPYDKTDDTGVVILRKQNLSILE